MSKRKSKISREEEEAIFENKLREELRKSISKDAKKYNLKVDVEQQVEQNLKVRMAIQFPNSSWKSSKSCGSKSSRNSHPNQSDFRDCSPGPPPDDISAEGPDFFRDMDEFKVQAWSELLRANMRSQGFVLPMLYRRKLFRNMARVAIPCLQEPFDSKAPKLDWNRWEFPGLSFRACSQGKLMQDSDAYFFCSCCSKSASYENSGALSQFAEPLEPGDECNCLCSRVLRHVISAEQISLQRLCDLTPTVNVHEVDFAESFGFSLGFVDKGRREIVQFGCSMEMATTGIVVQGKCVTCKSHSKCVHVRRFSEHHGDEDEISEGDASKFKFETYHEGLLKGSWGWASAEEFGDKLSRSLNDDKTALRLKGRSSKPFTLDGPPDKQASIHERSAFLSGQRRLCDPIEDGFCHEIVGSDSVLFTLHGANMHMEVSGVAMFNQHDTNIHTHTHAYIHAYIHAYCIYE
jgi:hypothetical protein